MGGNQSKSDVTQVNEFFKQTTENFMTTNRNTVNASNLGTSTITMKESSIKDCNFAIKNGVDLSTTATAELSATQITEMLSQLKTATDTEIDNQAKQSNGFIAPAVANSAEATTNLKNSVKEIIDRSVTVENIQEVVANAKGTATFDFIGMNLQCNPAYRFPGPCSMTDQSGCDFVIDQNVKSHLVAKGVADILTEALSSTISENSNKAVVKQSSTQENAGLDDLVAAITGPYAMISGIIVGVILLIICVVVVLAATKGKGAAAKMAGAAGGGGGFAMPPMPRMPYGPYS
jgi:hypothetical protein